VALGLRPSEDWQRRPGESSGLRPADAPAPPIPGRRRVVVGL